MAAITTPLLAREAMNQLAKREKNWAAQNVGVMVVFCIVFVVAVGVISIFVHKALQRRKERKPTY
ncbi:hypothetical protein VFPFJ_09524 [Purpureocillium lilacinum]|uniref:Uncharacterized protein n=1 Tax=Purpureocillium lilacinum TaxID=33203 RepID=A0A179GCD9_PURLI|nr:hypothetical protein VFPFJ_09524 [Purpureocillium lilacinum]OAQ75442.1 hypothetical protein VFPBJ_09415 [Purpureocillium lilacinum]OAQ81069.1 hypothetical protein VFPFJ_09524 [Purpureocillium lilacinum]GJN76194.1 hypothetical protein PLICBS_010306 [Purpureocillium lilacinum]GJN86614.1 hypothetical protein PLIIFM63780_010195 [Purpureocillium lilacinum]